MRLLLAVLCTLLLASPASAFCQSRPDNYASYNVENNTAQSLCLQQELSRQTELDAQQARIDAMIGNIQIEAERQQQMLYDRLNQNLFPITPY